ncbi:hypothetical protein BH20ACT2_BH20ACT2_13890 [soil metagenome]
MVVGPVVVLATTQQVIGSVIALIVGLGFIAYLVSNTAKAKPEAGSEIELASNRKPYLEDEQLEGRKLDHTLTWGLFTLVIIGVGLPLYWLAEPGRQAGAIDNFNRIFVDRGEEMFATTADGGLNCAGCHGAEGVGGVADFTLTDADGEFIDQVSWKAPALDTVMLRYSRDEVRYILEYGRPFSPMPAWGEEGGGPLTEQQIDNLVAYLDSIQITAEEAQQEVADGLDEEQAAAEEAGEAYGSDGEALFNLGYFADVGGGAYSCGRCHTEGWSYGDRSADGSGAFGPSLRGGATTRQFLTAEQQVEFVTTGSEDGVAYGQNGQGRHGMMPGFGLQPPEEAEIPGFEERGEGAGMMTPEQIEAIVNYERGL